MRLWREYSVALGIFLGVLLVATVIAWGAPPLPNFPAMSIDPGLCPEGFLITRTVYDTDPTGTGYYAIWEVNGTTFLVITNDGRDVIMAYVQLPGRDEAVLTFDQLRERYSTPCEIAALVTGAPK